MPTSNPHYDSEYQLVTKDKPKSAMAEAYRALRTNLNFAELARPFRTILVSSPSPRDGKSTITANLGVVLAQAGHQVLVLDCDLRKPVQHTIFALENGFGFTDYLRQTMPLAAVVHSGISDKLEIMTSGPIPPNPAEVLNSQRVRDVWPALLDKYDYVLIDAPPILAVTDASILASQVDGVILVARAGVTRKDQIQQAREQLAKGQANLIGVVLNQVDMAAEGYGYYYYYTHEEAPALY